MCMCVYIYIYIGLLVLAQLGGLGHRGRELGHLLGQLGDLLA